MFAHPTVSESSPRKLAAALKEQAVGDLAKPVWLRSLNFRRPDDTTWWLCPAPDLPAHHYGKYFVRAADTCGDLFVGICFEKGLNVPFRDRGSGRKRVLGADWVWNAFFDHLQNGEFDRNARTAQDGAGIPVNVALSARMMNPDVDVEERLTTLPDQRVYFAFDASRLSLLDEYVDTSQVIADASECSTLTEMAERINDSDNVDWMMVNIEVGFLLTIGDDASSSWSLDAIWSNACKPFMDWFRPSA